MGGTARRTSLPEHALVRVSRRVHAGALECRLYIRLLQHWRYRTEARPEPWRVESLRQRLRASALARLSAFDARLRNVRAALFERVLGERRFRSRLLAHLIVVDPTNLPVQLGPDDLELASTWPKNRGESEKNHRVRTRAARAAERAVAHYYSILSPPSKVVDVALGQIRHAPYSRWSWRVCDLDRDGVPVDVKNVRTLQRPDVADHSPRYAEWFVNDKSDDRYSSGVVIAATTTEPSDPDHPAPTRFVSSVTGAGTTGSATGDMPRRGAFALRVVRSPSRRTSTAGQGEFCRFSLLSAAQVIELLNPGPPNSPPSRL